MTNSANPPIPLPALLRYSRNIYGMAIRHALDAAGYDDIPRNGIYVIAAIGRANIPLSQIIRELNVSKQNAGQLVDMLVLRGYLQRDMYTEDRRRLTLTLTKRGRHAADVATQVVDEIQALLEERVGANAVAITRKTLAALGELSQRYLNDKDKDNDGE